MLIGWNGSSTHFVACMPECVILDLLFPSGSRSLSILCSFIAKRNRYSEFRNGLRSFVISLLQGSRAMGLIFFGRDCLCDIICCSIKVVLAVVDLVIVRMVSWVLN
jgi:hypothetical protein